MSGPKGHGPGFEKDVRSILGAFDRGLITALEARHELRVAGMDLGQDELPMPQVVFAPALDDYEE